MGFIKHFNNAPNEWKLAIRYLYRTLKKKKLYSEYKASFYPPGVFDIDPRTLGRKPKFLFNCKGKSMCYVGDRDVIYPIFKFFKTFKILEVLLFRTNASGKINNHDVLAEFPQVYFEDNYKGKKLPIRDRIFSLRFGLVASSLISIFQVLLVYACSPEIVTGFILVSISITLAAMFILLCFSLNFRKKDEFI